MRKLPEITRGPRQFFKMLKNGRPKAVATVNERIVFLIVSAIIAVAAAAYKLLSGSGYANPLPDSWFVYAAPLLIFCGVGALYFIPAMLKATDSRKQTGPDDDSAGRRN